MARDATWANSDGLTVGFGPHTVDLGMLVETGAAGNRHFGQMKLSYLGMEDTDAITTANPAFGGVVLPRGSVIVSAIIQGVVAWDSAGDAFTLDIGTYDADNSSSATVDDANGIDADIAQAALAVGTMVRCDGASVVHGDDTAAVAVGTTSNSDVVVVAGYEAAAPTAGEAVLYLEWITPLQGDATLAV